MRIRRKKWAVPELREALFCIDDPKKNAGIWRTQFIRPQQPLYVELGCGKGQFISTLALSRPDVNFLAIDKISNMLGVAKRAVEKKYGAAEKAVDNLLLTAWDVEQIDQILLPDDRVEVLYINFCNPWPKKSYHKHRLTHTRQLLLYRTFLSPDAHLYFKTDDTELFEDTHLYLSEAGFKVEYETTDLHAAGMENNIITEHEQMFSEQGIAIKFLVARMIEKE